MWRADSFEKALMPERLRAGGEGDNRGWDSWIESPTQWTLVWVDSASWWWTGRLGLLWFMGSQRVRHDWVTKLNWCRGVGDGQGSLTCCSSCGHKESDTPEWLNLSLTGDLCIPTQRANSKCEKKLMHSLLTSKDRQTSIDRDEASGNIQQAFLKITLWILKIQ